MQNSSSFPCWRHPANTHWNHPHPNNLARLCVYVCLCSQVTGMRNCSNLLLSPEEHLSCRAGELQCAAHRQPWHSLVLWHEWLWMIGRLQIPLQCHLCVSVGACCEWHEWKKADGDPREAAFAQLMDKEKPRGSYWHRQWTSRWHLICLSYFRNIFNFRAIFIRQACMSLPFLTNSRSDFVFFF